MAKKSSKSKSEQPLQRRCGTMQVHHRLLHTVPNYRKAREEIENLTFRTSISSMVARTGCTVIPVVVHVLYNTSAQNISDAQIESQIDVLNEDFRRKNADVSTTPAAFEPLVADARIQFELATTDPDGNPTDGITRTETPKTSFSATLDDAKSAATDGVDPWLRDEYLNIWVCPEIVNDLGNSLLGYAQFPGGPADTDGVVILHSAFGTTGTAAAPFNLGRTTTHEVGHWLNLRHIWGDDGDACSGSDFVADTPNQGGPNYGKPAFPSVSCSNGPNGDLFMNYMDYVDDDTMVMFTAGQVARMHAALDGPRINIGRSIPCAPVAPPKNPLKDLIKEPIKEFPKDLPKDFPKDPLKDVPKDLPKDPPKDIPKDIPKDFPWDPPGKGFFEFTGGFPGVFPGFPQGPPPVGGTPFVLATPSASPQGGGGVTSKQQALYAYGQLLRYYAQLHASGQLDAAGMSAWQRATEMYQKLLSS